MSVAYTLDQHFLHGGRHLSSTAGVDEASLIGYRGLFGTSNKFDL